MTKHKLVITEKPSVARSIAAVIGETNRQEGCLQGSGYIVSWCIGHLVSFADAGMYDERLKKWRYEDLRIIPESWRLTVLPDKRDRFDTLRTLLRSEEVSEVINTCYAIREGFAHLKPGWDYDPLHQSALCKSTCFTRTPGQRRTDRSALTPPGFSVSRASRPLTMAQTLYEKRLLRRTAASWTAPR
jgi:hypothetical protein